LPLWPPKNPSAPGQLAKGCPDVVVAAATGQAQHVVGIPLHMPRKAATATATGHTGGTATRRHEEQRRQQRQGQKAAKGSHGSQTFGKIWES